MLCCVARGWIRQEWNQTRTDLIIHMSALVPISIGELIDKITILQIKKNNISDPEKLSNISKELGFLENVVSDLSIDYPDGELGLIGLELFKVNQDLWLIEDQIRDLERLKKFDREFIDLARSVYMKNDRRASLKAQINLLAGSDIYEEKSYAAY